MYRSRTRDQSGLSRRLSDCIANVADFLKERHRLARPPHTVVAEQRAWQLKKMGRSAILCLLLAVLAGFGCWLTCRTIYRLNIFRLTEVVVQGNKMTGDQQIVDQAGLKTGTSLFSLDTVQAEHLIEALPWVEQARIQRNWPSTLVVVIREYRPLALVNVDQGGGKHLFYVDDEGRVFAPLSIVTDFDFPVLTGPLIIEDLKDMRIRGDSLTGKALDFLKLAAQGNQILPAQAVSEVHVDPGDGLIVYLVDHPFPIYMGKEHIRTRYDRLIKVLDRLYRQDMIKDISEIRVDYTENRILVAKLEL